ncbi:hypothetical protein ACJX0J_030546, partial [Zea mays]
MRYNRIYPLVGFLFFSKIIILANLALGTLDAPARFVKKVSMILIIPQKVLLLYSASNIFANNIVNFFANKTVNNLYKLILRWLLKILPILYTFRFYESYKISIYTGG